MIERAEITRIKNQESARSRNCNYNMRILALSCVKYEELKTTPKFELGHCRKALSTNEHYKNECRTDAVKIMVDKEGTWRRKRNAMMSHNVDCSPLMISKAQLRLTYST